MLGSDLLKVSLRQTYRNRRRYRSVIIALALGIAGIIVVMTLGDSVEKELGTNIGLLGSATVITAEFDFRSRHRWHHGQYFDRDMAGLRRIPGVMLVSPYLWKGVRITLGREKLQGRVAGADMNFLEANNIPVVGGRGISEKDVRARRSVCVISYWMAEDLFGSAAGSLGKVIFLDGGMFTIVGFTSELLGQEHRHSVFVPISVARSRFKGMHGIRRINIRADSWDSVESIQKTAFELLTRNQPGYAEAMVVRWNPDKIRTIQNTVLLVKLFVWAALGVTLLLGGLGITSVMHAAIRERTTEIGLRKAVGGTNPVIMLQFLLESVLMSLTGTAMGLLVGAVGVQALRHILGIEPEYETFMLTILGSTLLGLFLGIVTGIAPARSASRLAVIDAMRFE